MEPTLVLASTEGAWPTSPCEIRLRNQPGKASGVGDKHLFRAGAFKVPSTMGGVKKHILKL